MKRIQALLLPVLLAAAAYAAPKPAARPIVVNSPNAPQEANAEGGILQLGETVVVPADTRVQGSVTVLGGGARILGHVENDVLVLGGSTLIDGPVDGSVFLFGKTLELGPNAVIGGDLTTVGTRVTRNDGAVVRGETLTTEGFKLGILGMLAAAATFLAAFLFYLKILASFGWGLLAVVLAALFPGAIEDTAEALTDRPFASLAAGLLVWPASLLILATLIVSLIGLMLVPFLGMLLAVLIVWGYVAVAFWLGDRLFRAMSLYMQPWLSCLLGIALMQTLHWLPTIGPWVTLAARVLGLGAALLTLLMACLRWRVRPVAEAGR